MSLTTDLTQCQARLAEAGRKASAEVRKLKTTAPAVILNELLLQLCVFASETNQLKALLGALRMTGELEQRPLPVTAESLELSQCVRRGTEATPGGQECPRSLLLASLHRAGDHSLDDEPESLFAEAAKDERRGA